MNTRARLLATLVLVVPVVALLAVVWDTRPYSTEEIAADRARVEALPAYEQDVEECSAIMESMTSACAELAFAERTSITRDPLVLEARASRWVTLGLAGLALVVGARWPTGAGVRGLLTATTRLFVVATLSALVVSLLWWWGLEWVAEHRRLENTDGPGGVALRASLVVGLSAVVGLACAQLRGAVVRIVAVSVAVVALGLVLLVARPVAPWLPVLNVQALLLDGAEYDIPRDQAVCAPATYDGPPLIGAVVPHHYEYCAPDHRTRTSGAAALYLVGTTLVLLSAAALTRTRRRSRPRPLEV